MDGTRFDELTKALASNVSRRRLVRGAVGGAMGALGAALGGRGTSAEHTTTACARYTGLCSVSCCCTTAGAQCVCYSRDNCRCLCPEGASFDYATNACVCTETGQAPCGGVCCPAAPANATAACTNGQCDVACQQGYQLCGGQCTSTACPTGATFSLATCGCVCTATGQAPCGTGAAATCACEVAYGEACDQNTDCQAGSVCRPPDTRFDQTCTTTGPGGACCLNTAVAGGPCDEAADCRGFGENDPCQAVTCEGVCVRGSGVPCCTGLADNATCFNISQIQVCCGASAALWGKVASAGRANSGQGGRGPLRGGVTGAPSIPKLCLGLVRREGLHLPPCPPQPVPSCPCRGDRQLRPGDGAPLLGSAMMRWSARNNGAGTPPGGERPRRRPLGLVGSPLAAAWLLGDDAGHARAGHGDSRHVQRSDALVGNRAGYSRVLGPSAGPPPGPAGAAPPGSGLPTQAPGGCPSSSCLKPTSPACAGPDSWGEGGGGGDAPGTWESSRSTSSPRQWMRGRRGRVSRNRRRAGSASLIVTLG